MMSYTNLKRLKKVKKTDIEKIKIIQDKTDWKKVINSPQSIADIEAIKDSENPVLTDKKFVKSEKPTKP